MKKQLYVSCSADGEVLHISITTSKRSTKTGKVRTTNERVSIVGSESRQVREVINQFKVGTTVKTSVELNVDYGDD